MMGSTDVGRDLFVTPNSKTTLTAEKLLSYFEKITTSAPAQLLANNNLKKFIAVNESVKG
jgi:predicted Zn-dependent peptidase